MITNQEPDAELAEEPLVMLIILLVVKFNVVQRVVGRGQAHLTAPVELKLALLGVYFCFLEKAERERYEQSNNVHCSVATRVCKQDYDMSVCQHCGCTL